MDFLEIKNLLERSAFGVCSFIGERLGISTARIRLYFIYTSFVALGSPILLYLVTAFWLNISRYIRSQGGRLCILPQKGQLRVKA